jgi:integrase
MTLAQATAQSAAAKAARPRMHAFVMLSLCTGVRTEEARALRWGRVDFGDPCACLSTGASGDRKLARERASQPTDYA